MMMSETGTTSFLSEFPNQVEILHEVYVAMKLKSLPRDDLRLQVTHHDDCISALLDVSFSENLLIVLRQIVGYRICMQKH